MHKFNEIMMGAMDVGSSICLKSKHSQLSPIHILHGLVNSPQSISSSLFKERKKEIEGEMRRLPQIGKELRIEDLRPDSNLSRWITEASSRAVQRGKSEVEEEDFLVSLGSILSHYALSPEEIISHQKQEEEEMPAFLVNYNELARQGKLDPVIGRDQEIRSLMEILGRRSKNNPVLTGSAGVGKTAIVEGLAGKIIKNEVPDQLKNKTLYSLDLGQLMAGTKFRGEFEERIQHLLKFMKGQAHQAILFIDEIHQLVGAGKTDGAMDAANLLKPALARGELSCIGATTLEEFQKYILGDAALERRFRNVHVAEPTVEDAIEILMGLREKLEMHHGVRISDEAVYQAVILSEEYIKNKFLPDKAIDLLDEACSGLKLSAQSMPPHMVDLEREIRSKLIYSKVEKNNEEVLKEAEELKTKFEIEKEKWDKKVFAIKKMTEIKNLLDQKRFELDEAERMQSYEVASKLKYSDIPELEEKLRDIGHDWILSVNHIAQIISRQTGVPEDKILKNKQDKILGIGKYLKERIFGQDLSLNEVSDVLQTSFAGLKDPSRPLGSFLLLGPSGVGKTETAKAITHYLFNNEKNLVRFDMSEFQEKHSVAKLIGAPAGYVGYEEGGQLTEAIRQRPYSVILFDEIEKAHPDFSTILLQILDDGRLTDNKGRTISFHNTVILLTSNSKDYKAEFRPELIGRLDAILHYNALSQEVMKSLVDRQLEFLNERLKSKKITVTLSSGLIDFLMSKGYDPNYGARPLANIFEKEVTRPLSRKVLDGSLKEGVNIQMPFEELLASQ